MKMIFEELIAMRLSQIALCSCLFAVAILGGCQQSSKDHPASAAGVSEAKDPNRGFESPEAAWKAYASAEQEEDSATAIGTLTDDSQKVLAAQTMIALGFTVAFNKQFEEQVKALMEKHGIDPNNRQPPPGVDKNSTRLESFRAIGGQLNDPIAFVVEANHFMQSLGTLKSNSRRGKGELLDVAINGNTATATLKERSGRRTVEFRKEKGGWLVEITDSQLSMKPSGITTSGSGNIDRFGMDRTKHALPALAAITDADVEHAWKLSVDYQQQTAAAALQDITQKCGLEIYDQPNLSETLQKKIDIKLNDVSAVQVIEEICRQVDLQPRYKAGAMALWEGSRKLPIAFTGPFLVEVTKIQESIPNAFVKIDLQFLAAGLPASICSRLAGMYISEQPLPEKIGLTIPQLQATNGQSLDTIVDTRGFPAKASLKSIQFKASIEISKALNTVNSIAPFNSSFESTFPQKISTVTFGNLKQGETRDAESAKLTVSEIRTGAQTSVSFDLEGVTHEDLVATALDSNGKPIATQAFISDSQYAGKSTATVRVQGAIQQLQIGIIHEVKRVEFPYQLPAIPLTFHVDQPDQLEALKIKGDVPVTFDFVRVKEENNFRSTIFQWTNHSNKDVRHVAGKLKFLDTAGSVVKEQDIDQGSNPILLDYAESEETNLFGHSPPEGTATATITLTDVKFADSTEWSAKSN